MATSNTNPLELASDYWETFEAGLRQSSTPSFVTSSKKPSEEYDAYWIFVNTRPAGCPQKIYGKWLVFKHKSAIDETWQKISSAVLSGSLGSCKTAKVSTMKPNPNAFNPDMKVICVYTTEEDMDDVGMKLIPIVRQTIRYKTDEATFAGQYKVRGSVNTTCRTLEWNKGKPKFKD